MSDLTGPDLTGIVDQFGIPMRRVAQLRNEISPVGGQHARPPFDGHLAFGMDPSRLGAIVRGADFGQSRDWFILAEEIEELFTHYAAVLGKRRRQVAQLPITVEPANEETPEQQKHADFVRDWLDAGTLQRAMFDVTDAVGKGFSVCEIMWDTAPGRIVPAELIYRAPRHFEASWEDGATIWLRTETGYAELAPHKFLLHTHRSKSGNVIRSGLTRMVAFLWLYSTYTLKDWALFCQAYGMPIRVGRYGPEASEADKRVLWRAVSSIAGDVAAIIPKSMEMEFVKDGDRAAGKELYLARAEFLNHEVSKLVLGSTAGTDAIRGSNAAGNSHRAVEDDVEKFDAGLLAGTLTRQLIQPMIAFSFGRQDAYPRFVIGRPDQVPLRDVVDSVADLGPLGFKVRVSDLYERLQLTPPNEGDETIGGAPPAQPVKPPPIELPQPGGAAEMGSTLFGGLIARMSETTPPDVIEAMTQRLAADAAKAMRGLTGELRHAFETARDMRDLAHRVRALQLDPEAFAEAMARGMALAELVGQAALLDEMHKRSRA